MKNYFSNSSLLKFKDVLRKSGNTGDFMQSINTALWCGENQTALAQYKDYECFLDKIYSNKRVVDFYNDSYNLVDLPLED